MRRRGGKERREQKRGEVRIVRRERGKEEER